MPGVVTTNFRLHNAEQFYEAFSESSPSTIYLFIARSLSWDNEASPPTVADTVRTVSYDIWNNMLAMKKVPASSVSYVSTRRDWETGVVYARYKDDSATMWSNNYFVVTSDYNVYKCLYNNSGAVSTVQPTGTANVAITTADNYVWKYMYTVSPSKALSFLTSNWLPVQTLTGDDSSAQWDVQTASANGGIETYSIKAGGSNYKGHVGTAQAGNTTTITLASAASDTSGHYVNTSVYISGGTGAGQKRTITTYTGGSRLAVVTPTFSPAPDGTSTYVVGPRLLVNGDGTNANAYSVVSGGAISRIVTLNKGANYSYANVQVLGAYGSGASIYPHLSPAGGHGKNAVAELAGHNVMLSIKLTGSEANTFTTNNEFRTLGIILDPTFANGTVVSGSSYDQTTVLNITGLSGTGFIKDEKVIGRTSGATGYVVDCINNSKLRLTNVSGTFTTEVVDGNTSLTYATVSSITNPTVKKYSGKVLYIENRAAIPRASDQTEDLRIIIRF